MSSTPAADLPAPGTAPATLPAPVVRFLTAHYGPMAETAARGLPGPLKAVLRRAVGMLVRDPYPEESQPLADDSTERRVRASQSLTLLYKIDGEHIVIREVIVLPRVAVIRTVKTPPAEPEFVRVSGAPAASRPGAGRRLMVLARQSSAH